MIIEVIWVVLATLHIVPLAVYIIYMKHVSEKRPWDIKVDTLYEPTISVILPTFNEARAIEKKLNNMLEIDYPKEKIETIIVDSASTDGTSEIVQDWGNTHPGLKMKFLQEAERSGMVKALNVGLTVAEGEVIAKTDADCLWFKNSLREAIKYLADPTVGSVASLHSISAHKKTSAVTAEKTYRKFYSWLRIGESKLQSTVLYEGELMLIKRGVLEKIGNFDETLGADDVPMALRVTEQGFRAVTSEEAYFIELTPYTWRERFKQKIRRGRHVLQALWKYKYLNFKENAAFNNLILPMETYIYLINPLLAIPLVIFSPFIIVQYPWLLLLTGLLLFDGIRELVFTHVTDVAIMLVAFFKELRGRERITWQKIEEIR